MHYHAFHVLAGDMQTDTHKQTTYACRQHLYEYTLFAAIMVFVLGNGHGGTGSIIPNYRWECLAARHV